MAYFAVIFTSQLAPNTAGYEAASEAMLSRVSQMPGFLGFDSARGNDGLGITVSYWDSVEALKAWGKDPAHRAIQERGHKEWYQSFKIRIGKVEEEFL